MISTKYLLKLMHENDHVRNNSHVLNTILVKMQSVPQLASLSRPRFSKQVNYSLPTLVFPRLILRICRFWWRCRTGRRRSSRSRSTATVSSSR
jgi:hypothetical protein